MDAFPLGAGVPGIPTFDGVTAGYRPASHAETLLTAGSGILKAPTIPESDVYELKNWLHR
jgi:hypothetical protein